MKQNKLDKLKKIKLINPFSVNGRGVRRTDLSIGMLRVIILCWLVPYLTLSVVLFYYSETKTNMRIKNEVTTSMENIAEICRNNLLAAIAESKKASYQETIRESYQKFLETNDESQLHKEVTTYLDSEYKYSSSISNTILLFNRKMSMEYYTYSNVAGATYANINDFKAYAMPKVRAVARELGTGTKLVMASGHLYLVRNIVTSDYIPFAVLVMEISVDNMFKSLENVVWRKDGLIYLNDELIRGTQKLYGEESDELIEFVKENVLSYKVIGYDEIVHQYDYDKKIVYAIMRIDEQKISFAIKLDQVGILSEMSTLIYTYIIIVILFVPLIYATVRYFYRNVSNPISDLMYAAEKIEGEEYGYKIERFDRNREFGKLIDTFNDMSTSLKDAFNRIYAEEIAVRDANMQALQSQINPHFLNNTLEIINWKARMSGNDDVSAMIESLGIMMEATMNRNNESFIIIREEMKYVEAYLYIIIQRFGNKFKFTKEIDESLLNLKIPRLIIQPIVENMVDHGGDIYGNRVGKLKIFESEQYLHIVVENNGDISEEDAGKIETLLNPEKSGENARNIGIRNVNLRLKMLYGEQSGLTITNQGNHLTVSEIVIDKKKLQ